MTSSKPLDAVIFRTIQEKDFDDVISMVNAENFLFLPRNRMEIIFREGSANFYVLEDKLDGKVIGVLDVAQTRPNEAVLGNVVIRPSNRHKGLGTYMLLQALDIHKDTTVNWFSLADQFYENLGCSYGPQNAFLAIADYDRDSVNKYCQENNVESSITTVLFTEDRREDLILYDTKARGYENRKFMSLLIGWVDTIVLAVTDAEQRIVGYGASCNEDDTYMGFNGFYADDDVAAAALLRHILRVYPKLQTAVLYTLSTRQFLARLGQLTMGSEEKRMFYSPHGPPVQIPEDKLYSLSDPDVYY